MENESCKDLMVAVDERLKKKKGFGLRMVSPGDLSEMEESLGGS